MTVAWSCTIVPARTDVTTVCAALWIAVTVVELTLVTVRSSQAPVDGLLLLSPE